MSALKSPFFLPFSYRHRGLAPCSSGKAVWWGAGPRRTKRWNIYSINFLTLCCSNTHHTLCLYIDTIALREKPDPGWQRWSGGLANTGSPLTNCVYYNGKAAECWQCYITCISPLANSVFCLPACNSARRPVFIVCTSCVWPNQPNWVLGISLIPIEWLYFLLAPPPPYTQI